MNRRNGIASMRRLAPVLPGLLVLWALVVTSTAARADRGGLDVEVWTDRGNDAIYQPGNRMEIKARTSDDAYLLVYEIDSEGYVRLLYPYRGSRGYVEGRATYQVPPEQSNLDLVVESPVGQGYIVAIASLSPYQDLPWYLRPYDAQAEQIGFEGEANDEEGITAEGRIVGDPFVAMERIRRRVLEDPEDESGFATSYTSYYVSHEVRYPRYLCYDCHRPQHWAWWDGFDPYYASCSVFDFRVNWGWNWGPTYWFGYVPYYYYVYRYDCPPRFRVAVIDRWCSSWDGWRRWKTAWGGSLTRYKSDPPPGYTPPPPKFRDGTWRNGKTPPGFITSDVSRGRMGIGSRIPIGRRQPSRIDDGQGSRGGRDLPRGVGNERWRDDGRKGNESPSPGRIDRRRSEQPMPGHEPRIRDDANRNDRGRGWERPAPGRQQPDGRRDPNLDRRNDPSPPRGERGQERRVPIREWRNPERAPRDERRAEPMPRIERPRDERPPQPREQRFDRPRYEPPREQRYERPRFDPSPRERRADVPRYEPQGERLESPRFDPAPRFEPPREVRHEERPREAPRVEPQRSNPPQEKPRDAPRFEPFRGNGGQGRGVKGR